MGDMIPLGLDREALDREICEACLPGYMWNLLFSSLQRMGVEIREDMIILAERSSTRDLKDLDIFTVRRLAKKIENEGHKILSAGGDNPIQLVAGLTRLLINMAGEGVNFSENSMLLALAFNEEFKDEPSDFGGEAVVAETAGKMLNEAHARGWFKPSAKLQIIAPKN